MQRQTEAVDQRTEQNRNKEKFYNRCRSTEDSTLSNIQRATGTQVFKMTIKRQIKFDTDDEALQAFINAVNSIPEDDWCKCFDNWFSRMKSCIDAMGEYFEKH
ncbi:hypothetical protein LAZ67_X003794 [Cordylochernes scorpioides]|uniref:Uncharacterized protein n=1 Tax=Cordylochernes scorpioides TaxID=51811 RepID=A0ABY6LZA0_9ARAC|nr:hypothetical protein LAZ67_X003794 [Cordylochernes scorpioides]